MSSPQPLTDKRHWEDAWTRHVGVRRLSPSDSVLGRRGFFLRALPDLRRRTVVELGGAGSYYLLALAKWQGVTATAVDYSAAGLALTKAIFTANACSVDLVNADVFAWQTPQRFDAVLHFGLLEHFRDPGPLVQRSADLLAPGGQLIFTMPNMQAWGAGLWRTYSPKNWSQHVFHSDEVVRSACTASGLRLQRSFHFGWPLIQIADWERRSIALSALSLLQRATNIAAPLYASGNSAISCYRGFVATRVD